MIYQSNCTDAQLACKHTKTVWEDDGYEDDYTFQWVENLIPVERYTFQDIDLHRYKCTQCGVIMYYSGRAKDHFENGTHYDIQGLKIKE